MILTAGQEAALKMVAGLKTFKERPHVAVLAGFAGTGKSFLLGKIPEVLAGVPVVIAPTGKAAVRVRELTGIQARTIHSFIYNAAENLQTGEIVYSRKPLRQLQEDSGEVPLIIIDEASMVDENLWDDVFDVATILHMNLLVVGDGFQLPPVKQKQGEREFNLLSRDFCYDSRTDLTEVVRQAKDDPVIRASMLIREGDPGQAVLQLPRIPSRELLGYAASILRDGGDAAVIVHQNATRQHLNLAIRRELGLPEDELVQGEPLLILHNNYRLQKFNGEIVRFGSWVQEPRASHKIKDWLRKHKQEPESKFGVAHLQGGADRDNCSLAVNEVWGKLSEVSLPAIQRMAKVVSGGGSLTYEEAQSMTTEEINARLGPPHLHANVGYALTCHKAQGSEFDSVLVVLESSVRLGTSEGRRWTYTAVTRSRKSLKLCLGAGPGGRT